MSRPGSTLPLLAATRRPSCSAFGIRDVIAGILKGDELATARQRDWIVKALLPAAIASGPSLFLSNSVLEPFGICGCHIIVTRVTSLN